MFCMKSLIIFFRVIQANCIQFICNLFMFTSSISETEFISSHGYITCIIDRFNHFHQAFDSCKRMGFPICFTDFITNRPHDNSRIVFISFYHCSKIVVGPFFTFSCFRVGSIFFKETTIVVWFLTSIPSIKGFFLNQQTKFSCNLQGLRTCWVVSRTNRIHSHFLHLFQTTIFCLIVFFCS